ncbi:UNVERIFIED_CONTAM: protein salt-induced and EIN3/EIL1-dependent 1 [Sesamum calycinum]|uniref:Protein salt-induced and EIN3/EIL1-dependent 1 n=1 Tax=Sesamum calycinum TaxID=2727403 RepID=A0AAW2NUQ2_9LAMI
MKDLGKRCTTKDIAKLHTFEVDLLYCICWTLSRNYKEGRKEDEQEERAEAGPEVELVAAESEPGAGGVATRSSTVSPPSSCVSSEQDESRSPEATSMMLVGCPRCLMYVMLAEEDPRCPKCKSTVLLDFIRDNAARKTKKS